MKEFFTDGSAVPNPGKGGFAVVCAGEPVALGQEVPTTNIRMEARAILAAYDLAEAGDVIWTDSEFWLKVVRDWAPKWEENGWKKKGGEIKNLDLVQELLAVYRGNPEVKLKWTRGHAGTAGNELADEWANRAREGETL